MSVIFDQLRISDDGRRLYVNAHVNTADYFKDVHVESITIVTADKVSETDPGVPVSEYIYYKDLCNTPKCSCDCGCCQKENCKGRKSVSLVLDASDFIRTWETDPKAMRFSQADMSRTLFFVYIKCGGTPASNTPCTLDEMTTVGVTFDVNMLYQKVMDYTRELARDCSISMGFTDFILKWNAFKAAVETEHWIQAIKFFNMLFEDYSAYNTVKDCGCNG